MPLTLTRARARQGGYLAKTCTEAIAKDNMPATYPVELKDPRSPFMTDLFDNGNKFEAHIGQRLVEETIPGQVAFIAEERDPDGERTKQAKDAKERDTFAAYLNPMVRAIWNPRIGPVFEQLLSDHLGYEVVDHDRISEPDMIELGQVLPNGLRAMRFIDVKWHKVTSGNSVNPKVMWISRLNLPFRDFSFEQMEFYGALHAEDWLQLSHYHRHAQQLGLTAPASADGGLWAGVIGKEEVVVWGDLDQLVFQKTNDNGRRVRIGPLQAYDAAFAKALAVIDNAIERDTDPTIPALVTPQWSADCKECPWHTVCHQELTEFGDGGHITLLPGITPARAIPLYAAGIHDVATLAAADPTVIDPERVFTARVKLAGRPHLAIDVEGLDLPRGDVEVDFDCESDDTVYMWGVRVTDRATGTVTVTTFDTYTGTPEGEAEVFAAVWAYFQQVIVDAEADDRSVVLYHYTRYEHTQMSALAKTHAGKPGIPTEEQVDDLFDSGMVVDLYEVLSTQLLWPTESHSIKKLAVFTGFAWRDQTPGGDMSMLWYRAGRDDPDEIVRAENIARLREYNEDDVHAQAHLRDWATSTQFAPALTLGPRP